MIYNLAIYIYVSAVRLAALFSKKVSKMVKGEQEAFTVLKQKIDPQAKYIWFHAASLGEFEQGRPLIELIRKRFPQYRILQTFFSPSGYEVRKHYRGADIVCYLPFDKPRNVRKFLDICNPCMAFFIKYEFWYNYLHLLRQQGVPTYSVSSIFRPSQVFFKWYGMGYGNVLRCVTRFFVQNEESRQLLRSIHIDAVDVVGDTRFDRVLTIKQAAKQLPLVEAFVGDTPQVFVAGSSWPPDEDIFIRFFNSHPEWKLIIAPHVIAEEHLRQILSKLNRKTVRYTQATPETAAQADCLIIDCFGLLSSIYHYGNVAYVGGGFGVGIHNTLEAAVWDIPVIFGPNNRKFMEAQGLLASGGGFEIADYDDFHSLMRRFMSSPQFVKDVGKKAGAYVQSLSGASEKILSSIEL